MKKSAMLINSILIMSIAGHSVAEEQAKPKPKLRIAVSQPSELKTATTGSKVQGKPAKAASSATANPVRPQRSQSGPSTVFWIGLGGTAATGVLAGVFWGVTESNYRDFQDYNEEIEKKPFGDPSLPQLIEDRNRKRQDTQNFGNAAVSFTIAASVFAAATIVTLIIDCTGADFGKVKTHKTDLAVVPFGLEVRF